MMKEKEYLEAYKDIEVPQDSLKQAIKVGKYRAQQKKRKSQPRIKSVVILSSVAAIILLFTSFLSPTFSQAMAQIPLIGNVYATFNDSVGRSLQSQGLVTELHETSTQHGMGIEMNEVYYDGTIVGAVFSVTGIDSKEEQIQALYEIFDGDENISESQELVHMKKDGERYIGHIQFPYPKKELPKETTFPLAFLSVGEQEGNWKFDVPIKQLPYETVKVNKSVTDEKLDMKLHIDSVIKGKASTTIEYTATFPKDEQHDFVELNASDYSGKPIEISIDHSIQRGVADGRFIVKGRSIILERLNEDDLILQPFVRLSTPDQFISLKHKLPFKIASKRQAFSVEIDKLEVHKGKVTFDYQINQGETFGRDFTFYKDFAKNDITIVEKERKDIYEAPMKHKTEVIDQEALHFRSTYEIKGDEDDYIIRVNLGSLSANIPLQLDEMKIPLR